MKEKYTIVKFYGINPRGFNKLMDTCETDNEERGEKLGEMSWIAWDKNERAIKDLLKEK